MKMLMLILGTWASVPTFARSLDRARALAVPLEARLPGGGPLLCAACDDGWSEGGEPVRRLEHLLGRVVADPRAAAIENYEQLGVLMSEHFTFILSAAANGAKTPPAVGKATFCALSRPPAELFSPKIFGEFCTPPEGR